MRLDDLMMRLGCVTALALLTFACGDDGVLPETDGGLDSIVALDAPGGDGDNATIDSGGPLTCDEGTADCNDDEADGCEVVLDARANCGGCGVSCSSSEFCSDTRECIGSTATSLAQFSFAPIAYVFDTDGSFYYGGNFGEPRDFGRGIVRPVGRDMYIAHYSATGELVWVQTVPVPGGRREYPYNIVLDGDSVYAHGELENEADFGDGVVRGDSAGTSSHAFVASWSKAGAFRWADAYEVGAGSTTPGRIAVQGTSMTAFTRTSRGWEMRTYNTESGRSSAPTFFEYPDPGLSSNFFLNDAVITSSGIRYVAGSYAGSVSFGAPRMTTAPRGVVASYSSALGLRRIVETGSNEDRSSRVAAVELAGDDGIYLVESITPPPSPSHTDGIVKHLDAAGDVVWENRVPTPDGSGLTWIGLHATDETVLAVGVLQGEANFGEVQLVSTPSEADPDVPSIDVVVASFDRETGAFRWARLFGGDQDEGLPGFSARVSGFGNSVAFVVQTTGLLDVDGVLVEPAGSPTYNVVLVSDD